MQSLIILRGAPSSGKSTIAKSLKSLKNKIAWLKVDNFKPFFAKDVAEENEAIDYVNQTAIASLDYLLKQGFSVVMEGIFQNPKYITKAVNIAKQLNIQCKVYELECPLEFLQARDKVRDGVKEGCRKPLGDEVIAKLNQVILENPWSGAEKLDTGKLSLNKCIDVLSKDLKIK
ncbi:MAG: AAA family ATPase [Candidatus Woesebacteria bacterium]|jgi:predicted kinase